MSGDVSERNRDRDLLTLANHVRSGLFTWAMPADWGVDFGGGDFEGADNDGERSYSSADEVLLVLGIPRPPDEDGEPGEGEYPPELRGYARSLWGSLGPFMRQRCVMTLKEGEDASG